MIWIALFSALAIFFLLFSQGDRKGRGISRLRILQGGSTGQVSNQGGKRDFFKLVALKAYSLTPASARKRIGAGLERWVRLSGYSMEQLTGIRILATFSFPLAILTAFRLSPPGLVFLVPAAALGLFYPVMLASRRRTRYLDAVQGALPHTADMLYAYILGGRNLEQAFRGAAQSSTHPLKPLLLEVVGKMELGSSREEAFNGLIESCPLPELASLLRSLLEAEQRGYPLSTTLEVFSRDIRLRRRDRVRVVVAKAPLKILAPLVFLILPASVLLTVGPTFLATLKRII